MFQLRTPDFGKLNVDVPDFVKDLNTVITGTGMDRLRDYMTWHYLNASATKLTQGFYG